VIRLVKKILSGFKYQVDSDNQVHRSTFRLTVRRLPLGGDDLVDAWAEAMDVIKAQAARVLQEKQPVLVSTAAGTDDTLGNADIVLLSSDANTTTALDGTLVTTRDSVKAQATRVVHEHLQLAPVSDGLDGLLGGRTTSEDADYEKFSDSDLD
jgi:hypothetical protein